MECGDIVARHPEHGERSAVKVRVVAVLHIDNQDEREDVTMICLMVLDQTA